MSELVKIKSFIRQFAAFVKGDDTAALAEKVFRQAESALKSQISSLEGDTIDKEDAVTLAQEALAEVRINHGKPIVDRNRYAEGILTAKNTITKAEETLDLHKQKIEVFKQELELLREEVPE